MMDCLNSIQYVGVSLLALGLMCISIHLTLMSYSDDWAHGVDNTVVDLSYIGDKLGMQVKWNTT